MFCTSCGKKIEDGSLFCEHCGAKQGSQGPVVPPPQPLPQVTPFTTPPPVPESPAAHTPKAKKPLSLGAKILIGVICVGVIGVVAAKGIMGSINDPNKTINQFVEAIRSQDGESLRKIVTVTGGELELTDEVLAPFFTAYSKDADALSAFQADLLNDLTYLNRGLTAPGDGFMRLIKTSNPLFSSYSIEFTPISVSVESDFDDVILSLGDKEYPIKAFSQTIPLLPGNYTGEARYTDPVTGATLTAQVQRQQITRYNDAFYLFFPYTWAYFETNYADLTLTGIYIDGTPYAGNLEELDPYYGFIISPVAYDSQARVTYTIGDMEFEETFDLGEEGTCWLEPHLSDDLRAAGEAMAADVAQYVLDLEWTSDLTLLDQLVSSYGVSSPDFIQTWSDHVYAERNKYFSGDYDSYIILEDLNTETVDSQIYADPDNGLTLYCEVTLSCSSAKAYDWNTDEFYYDYGPDTFTVYVTLGLADGQWMVMYANL